MNSNKQQQAQNTLPETSGKSPIPISIQEVDEVSIAILVDNYVDFLLTDSAHAIRPPLTANERLIVLPPPVAEHGFSALVKIKRHGESEENNNKKDIDRNGNDNTFLFDTGVSQNGVMHNAKVFGMDLSGIGGIILSHGHFDHFAGLVNVLEAMASFGSKPKPDVDLFLHPDAFLRRWEVFPDGKKAKMPFLDEKQLENAGATIHKSKDPVCLPNGDSPLLLITGQIPRETSFEKGFPFQYAEEPGDERNLVPDPLVKDDQAIVVSVRDKGLVILTGCGHSGIINTLNYAKKLTGTDKVHAVIGGFHLPSDAGIYEGAIGPTLDELQKADPDYIIPCHCTGWKATNKIIDTMPEKFIQTSVGTTFTF